MRLLRLRCVYQKSCKIIEVVGNQQRFFAVARVWFAQEVRLTLFPGEQLDPSQPSSLWQAFTGAAPDNDEFVRVQNIRRQAGPYGEAGVLQLVLQRERIDWHLVAAVGDGLPILGTSDEVVRELVTRLTKWLDASPFSFTRVALAPTLISPVADRLEGYRTLAELVSSLRIDPDADISDLLLQINRRAESKVVAGLKINRVMKWSVSAVQAVMVGIGLGETPQVSTREALYACRLELDINTVPVQGDGQGLDSPVLPAIFEEFAAMASAIATTGELA